MISQEELKDVIDYNQETGIFTWKKKVSRNIKINQIAGYIQSDGYSAIKINKKMHKSHRLAWLFVYGEFPNGEIDHINHERSDNRICNLRDVSKRENNKNKSKSNRNKSGVVGVYWHKSNKRWYSSITIDNEAVFLGTFANFSDAVNARKNAEILYGFHKNHGE